MKEDLQLFLHQHADVFTAWLGDILNKLKDVTKPKPKPKPGPRQQIERAIFENLILAGEGKEKKTTVTKKKDDKVKKKKKKPADGS